MADANTGNPEREIVGFDQFLLSAAPGERCLVEGSRGVGGIVYIKAIDIYQHCPSEKCGGDRVFQCIDDGQHFYCQPDKISEDFIHYVCRNCRARVCRFAIMSSIEDGTTNIVEVRKLGQTPPFGPHIPSRAITLIGPDRELFLKGYRAENQRLGIGAYAYYRRVIENQKNRLLDEIIRVAKATGSQDAVVEALEHAKSEQQFKKALAGIKDVVPESLRIDGHSPLTLLHSAFSDGLHSKSDEECLSLAASAREVLFELADRIGVLLKDKAHLKQSISNLVQARSKVKP